jgi:hypothetical protein
LRVILGGSLILTAMIIAELTEARKVVHLE